MRLNANHIMLRSIVLAKVGEKLSLMIHTSKYDEHVAARDCCYTLNELIQPLARPLILRRDMEFVTSELW